MTYLVVKYYIKTLEFIIKLKSQKLWQGMPTTFENVGWLQDSGQNHSHNIFDASAPMDPLRFQFLQIISFYLIYKNNSLATVIQLLKKELI